MDESTKWLRRIFFVGLFAVIISVGVGATFFRQRSSTEMRLDLLEESARKQIDFNKTVTEILLKKYIYGTRNPRSSRHRNASDRRARRPQMAITRLTLRR